MTESKASEAVLAFNAGIVDEFRAHEGKVGGPFDGVPLLLLHTTGAKSGQPRISPLAYLPIEGKIIIVGSNAGADTNPDLVHNLRAHPYARIEIGADAYDVVARELPPDEREAAFQVITVFAPMIAEHQAKTSRVIPLFELVRT